MDKGAHTSSRRGHRWRSDPMTNWSFVRFPPITNQRACSMCLLWCLLQCVSTEARFICTKFLCAMVVIFSTSSVRIFDGRGERKDERRSLTFAQHKLLIIKRRVPCFIIIIITLQTLDSLTTQTREYTTTSMSYHHAGIASGWLT